MLQPIISTLPSLISEQLANADWEDEEGSLDYGVKHY